MLSEEIGPSVELASIVDVYAVAPYFGRIVHSPEKLDGAFRKNKTQVHGAPAGVFTPISGERTNRYGGPYAGIVRDLRGLKEFPNIRYAAYEGGPHFLGFDPAIRDRVIALDLPRHTRSQLLQPEPRDSTSKKEPPVVGGEED